MTQEYFKACLYLLFDIFTFYCRDESCRNTLIEVLKSDQVRNLVHVLDNFKQRDDIRDLITFIDQKYALMD